MKVDFKKENEELAKRFSLEVSSAINDSLKPLAEENKQLKLEIETLQSKVYNLQKEIRKNNLILHGVTETQTNSAELRVKVSQTLNKTCNNTEVREWDEWEVSDVKKLGNSSPDKTRPIMVTLTLTWRKIELLKNNKNFPSGIYVTPDYPKEILLKRKELMKEKEEKEKKGNIAYIRYDKLIVRSKEDRENNRKRLPSKSPSEKNKTKR
ncbi:unnamed protein product [Chilo suppressalis]|uniref:Endonuclease-reverse transcriptase n=1 Tax=Chilo suppressalis TaxID=168631 RepID=A0ABN8BB43_CHISP|nr:unnamed protein product [Chilo suppressalis]